MRIKFISDISTLKTLGCEANILEAKGHQYFVEITKVTERCKLKIGTKLLINKLNCELI